MAYVVFFYFFLRVRMRYGHLDVFDRIFHITCGGFCKASHIINIREDIFAAQRRKMHKILSDVSRLHMQGEVYWTNFLVLTRPYGRETSLTMNTYSSKRKRCSA
ncbi:hypothetical protein RND81_12G059100 [Saponaria officinalis]|uniref:Glycosyl transferase 48 domain-containing protein n=1 Tax=Saponaria officinalis TaxID=3572 RepID=A0AAW1H5W4_SAPOF